MVIDGLSRSFAAVRSDDGSYTGGKEIGNAIEMSFEPGESKDNPLYANNTIVESDSSVASAKVTITNDGISLADLAFLLGSTLDTVTLTGASTTSIKELMVDGANPSYMGYGTVARLQSGGVDKYKAIVIRKIKFAVPKFGGKTQGESKDWQTQAISGTSYRDDKGSKAGFAKISSELDTEADAVLYIKNVLGITAA